MNAPSGAFRAEPAIDLALEAAFALGSLTVSPATREVNGPAGREVLEPRVMQVLVALAGADGAVVSRDRLVASCWDGRIVGDDALNRCVQRLRRLGRDHAGAFEIETVPRVGYRLARAPGVAAASASEAAPRRRPLGRPVLLAAALAVVIAAVTVWATRPHEWIATGDAPLVATPIPESAPALSPDGVTLAYQAAEPNDDWRIHLRGVDGSQPLVIPGLRGWDDEGPAWSPRGDWIAFVSARAGERCRILVIRPPRDAPREVARCVGAEFSRVSWTPDGRALLFSDRPAGAADRRIVRLDLANGARRDETRPPAGFGDYEAQPSGDGRWLALGRRRNLDTLSLVTRDLRSGRETVLADDVEGFGWAPDSRTLFVTRHAESGYGVWTYAPGSARGRLVTPLSERAGRLAAARGWLAYASQGARVDVALAPLPGAAPQPLNPASGGTIGFEFRKDGALALTSTRSGRAELWLKRPGQPAQALSSVGAETAYAPRWSPDGNRIAVPMMEDDRFFVRVFGAAGEPLARVAAPSEDIDDVAWSQDGGALLIPARDAKGWRIWRYRLGGRRFEPTATTGWRFLRQSEGVLYATRESDGSVWQVSGTPRVVLRGDRRRSATCLGGWTVRGGRVVYLDRRDDARPRLVSASLDGGPETVTAAPHAYAFSDVDVEPLSGRAAYATVVGQVADIRRLSFARR